MGGEKQSGGDHYCCMLFMPREKAIHVLGKRHKETSQQKQPSDWESWGGSNIWRNIAILHGWDTAGETVVYERNWVQNGLDHTLQFQYPWRYSGSKGILLCIAVWLLLCRGSLQEIGGCMGTTGKGSWLYFRVPEANRGAKWSFGGPILPMPMPS